MNQQVRYNFLGFFASVDRPNTMNVSKAGQAIPLKWRLTDANGVPITDLIGVTVQAVSLTCSYGTTVDQIEEYYRASRIMAGKFVTTPATPRPHNVCAVATSFTVHTCTGQPSLRAAATNPRVGTGRPRCRTGTDSVR